MLLKLHQCCCLIFNSVYKIILQLYGQIMSLCNYLCSKISAELGECFSFPFCNKYLFFCNVIPVALNAGSLLVPVILLLCCLNLFFGYIHVHILFPTFYINNFFIRYIFEGTNVYSSFPNKFV